MANLRVLLRQVEQTLVMNGALFPHVTEAIEAFSRFQSHRGDPLRMGLVACDTNPAQPDNIQALLDQVGLTQFLEGPDDQMTRWDPCQGQCPSRRCFESAVSRLGESADLDTVALVTADNRWLAPCRDDGLRALWFDPWVSPEGDFSGWGDALAGDVERLDRQFGIWCSTEALEQIAAGGPREIGPPGRDGRCRAR